MTDTTIDVAALVERLRAADRPHLSDLAVSVHEHLCREAATALQSQADALAEARRLVSESEAQRYRSCGELLTRATTAEASLATMREALDSADLQIHYLHEKLGNETGSGNAVLAQIRAAKEGK